LLWPKVEHNLNRNYTVLDLFCGTGGFAQGFVNFSKNFEILYANDFDAAAAATAAANHAETCIVDNRDIRCVAPSEVKKLIGNEKIDVIIGGPPCQGFSSLRPFRSDSNEDARNDLYLEFAKFVEYFRPKVVVMENVVGLLTHNSGDTLDKILNHFHSLKYRVDWRLLNAASFGVPQKRERFIMIASRDNGPVLFPEPTHFFSGKVIGHKDKTRYLLADESSSDAITVNEAIDDLPHLERNEEVDKYDKAPKNEYQRARRKGSKILTLHKSANHNDKMMEVIRHAGGNINCIPKHLISSGFSSCYSRLSGDEPSTTITVKFQSPASSKCIHPTQDRTITPREAARIQSFDDSFIFKGSLTQIAAQIGNAVPPLLGGSIAKAVAEILGSSAKVIKGKLYEKVSRG